MTISTNTSISARRGFCAVLLFFAYAAALFWTPLHLAAHAHDYEHHHRPGLVPVEEAPCAEEPEHEQSREHQDHPASDHQFKSIHSLAKSKLQPAIVGVAFIALPPVWKVSFQSIASIVEPTGPSQYSPEQPRSPPRL